MKNIYPVIFTQTEDVILIEVPDLEILTQGIDIVGAIEMARDAIGSKGIVIEDDGDEIPVPSDINEIDLKNSTFSNDGESTISLVEIDFLEYRKNLK